MPSSPKGCPFPHGDSSAAAWAVHPTTSETGPAPHIAFPPIYECLGPLHWLIKNSSLLFQTVPTCFLSSRLSTLGISLPTLKGQAGNSPVCWAPSPFCWVSICSPGGFGRGALGSSCRLGLFVWLKQHLAAGCDERDPTQKQVFMLSPLAYVGGRLQSPFTPVWDS